VQCGVAYTAVRVDRSIHCQLRTTYTTYHTGYVDIGHLIIPFDHVQSLPNLVEHIKIRAQSCI
jgi:hypothetical protein